MTTIQLYKFIQENKVETDWRDEKLLAWIHPYDLNEFSKLADGYVTDNYPEGTLVSGGNVCFDLVPFCDYYGIDPEEIEKRVTEVA